MDFSPLVDMAIIDGHIHFRDIRWTEEIGQLMARVPLRAINLVSTPNMQTVNQNAELIYLKHRYSGRFYLSGGLDLMQVAAEPDRMSELLAAQVHTLKQIGFDGLKIIEGKPTARQRTNIPLDAPQYEGMWAALEALNMPVVWHVADPEEFWDAERVPDWARQHGWFYGQGGFPTKEALYAEVDHVLERHPRLKVSFAHFYFLAADLERAGRFLDAHPTVCFDITPGSEMYNHFTRNDEAARAFFQRYRDRLVYGTDIHTGLFAEQGVDGALPLAWFVRTFLETAAPFTPPPSIAHWLEPDLEAIRPLALPREVLAQIYHANFQRLFGAAPAPLNREAARVELERMIDEIEASAGGEADLSRQARLALKELA